VDGTATGAGDGSSWIDAFTDLQAALAAAMSGDEIWVAKGTYTPSVPAGRDATFRLLDGVALYGGFSGIEDQREERNWTAHETILSGDLNGDDGTDVYGFPIHRDDNAYHVITGSGTDATALLDGFTVRGGQMGPSPGTAEVRGAGMYNVTGSPTVAHCTFLDNQAGLGSGMFNDCGSSPRVSDCRFASNSGTAGVGMYNRDDSAPTVTDCTFEDNHGGGSRGGGMTNEDSSPTVMGCTFSLSYGAGMYNMRSSPTVSDCTFFRNVGANGGGMCNVAASQPTVSGCVFSNNNAVSHGGGMYNSDSSPTVSGCSFAGNSAYGQGGGMYNVVSSPTVTDCTFEDNSAGECGGGMYNFDNSSPTVSGCVFVANDAQYHGGGMCNEYGSPSVIGCTFERNQADSSGGGMRNRYSNPLVTGCTFSNGNSSHAGGGMYNTLSSPTIIECTFSDNVAVQWGGGMCNIIESHPTVSDCTFSGNVALQGGGMCNNTSSPTVTDCTFSGNRVEGSSSAGAGVCNMYDSSPTITHCTFSENLGGLGAGMYNIGGSNPAVKHTILSGNTPDDCYQSASSAFISGGYNLEGGTSCGCTQRTDQQNSDPLLDPLADNGGPTRTHALLPGSPALDVIPWPGAPTTDQRGFPRPYPAGGLADIGAVEMQQAHGRGDVDGDGAISLLDVVLCQQIASGIVRGTAGQRAAADVDGDGDVDADDVTILSEYVLGIRTTLP
jgi:hypothetical protein